MRNLKAIAGAGLIVLLLTAASALVQAQNLDTTVTIKSRHISVSRDRAASMPRSEHDQPLVAGWPFYRTERGQAAFNDAMATLKATEGPSPRSENFKGCQDLLCRLTLPEAKEDGWLPAGRLWVAPQSYILFVQSPRSRNERRRSIMNMQYFVFHEFHNGTRNTDTFDTISSHSGGVFVPFYMSKQHTDAKGRSFVMVVQVAPHDVVSVHASNMGSAGPGIEVAKNASDSLEPLQALAGIVTAEIVKSAVPRLKVVNHRGSEGLPMLNQYQARLASLRAQPEANPVALPFIPAPPQRTASAQVAKLDELIWRRGTSPPIPVVERAVVARRPAVAAIPADMAIPSLASSFQPPRVNGLRLIEAPHLVPRPAVASEPDATTEPHSRRGAGRNRRS